ncbi:MAG: hypothetical protein BWY50_01103 [Spirochaetes bacterium ADurb.Bin315]|jgi:predicted DNA-binding protein (UPF0251 family)|nr:DUF134 domain-containing protein [Spirochaetales bacterium]OQA43117.1 MAG: hypothetical protein BWY50_01103 [Spirochaetes bacterium ADurb.Bin315]HOR80964.1 DUF134 domain-containing protein [Sphaerochaeta sp.]
MSRPRKFRNVCSLPQVTEFGPLAGPPNHGDAIILSVDEYETLRLIDTVGMTQEECALEMGVGRSTIQGIYNVARRKVSTALVEGKILSIRGGDYRLREHRGGGHGCGRGCGMGRRRGQRGEFQ